MSSHLVDIGINLAHRLFDRDRAAVIERAAAAGVTTMVITGTSVETSRRAVDLARTYPGRLYATAGVHPHDAKRCDATTIDRLRAFFGLGARAEVPR